MTSPEGHLAILARQHPAAHRCLSDVGRRLVYPLGIPAQAAEAAGTTLNATIGQITDGRGNPLPLPAMSNHVGPSLDARGAFLYAPQGGFPELRDRWAARIAARGDVAMSRPIVTHGLTQALWVAFTMFADSGTEVLLPRPGWGNYRTQAVGLRGATVRTYDVLPPTPDHGGMQIEGLQQALEAVQGRPAVLVVNFPSNPVGYTPTEAEGEALAELILAHPGPLVVLCDDAYQDIVFEAGLMRRSLFYDLTARADPSRLLVAKVDGATKELVFFGGRVGFLTFGVSGEAGAVLEDKARAALRASTSSPSGIPQQVVLEGLRHPDVDAQRRAVIDLLATRYRALKDALRAEGLAAWPFNSGCFCILPVGRDPEALRHELLADGVGVVSINDVPSLRIAFCSVAAEDIPELVRRIRARIGT